MNSDARKYTVSWSFGLPSRAGDGQGTFLAYSAEDAAFQAMVGRPAAHLTSVAPAPGSPGASATELLSLRSAAQKAVSAIDAHFGKAPAAFREAREALLIALGEAEGL